MPTSPSEPGYGLHSDLFSLAEETKPQLSRAALNQFLTQADFGRTTSGRWASIMANYARWVLGIFVAALLSFQFLLVSSNQAKLFIGLGLGFSLLYPALHSLFLLRSETRVPLTLLSALEQRMPWALLVGVTALLLVLASAGDDVGALWLLYLPPLAAISVAGQPRVFWATLLGAAAITAGVTFIELRNDAQSTSHLCGEMGVRAVSLLAAGFLVDYFVRGALLWERGSSRRADLHRRLTERLVVETEPLALWAAICAACVTAINAADGEIYVYEYAVDNDDAESSGRKRRLRLLRSETNSQSGKETYYLSRPSADRWKSHRLAKKALYTNQLEDRELGPGLFEVAAPIHGHPRGERYLLAVVVLRFEAHTSQEKVAARLFLHEFLAQIWPIATYASLRFSGQNVQRLSVRDVVQNALDTICDKFDFEFATISLVDEVAQEIRCLEGRNVPAGWVADAHHPLQPAEGEKEDIQAMVVRTGETVVCEGWHDNFDERMFDKHGHHDLIRVFLPLGGADAIGTIEAGVRKSSGGTLHDLQIAILERYGRLNLTTALQNALLHERLEQILTPLDRLHRVIYEWQMDQEPLNDQDRWLRIARSAKEVIEADLVMVYPLEASDQRNAEGFQFGSPIIYPPEALRGTNKLKPPQGADNIVFRIVEMGEVYAPTALAHPWLQPTDGGANFTIQQRVQSFSGLPLYGDGTLLGVLCLNFRNPRLFSPTERRLISLFAQQASALISGHHKVRDMVRSHERDRFERFLHDGVQTNVRALDDYFTYSLDILSGNEIVDSSSLKALEGYLAKCRHIATAIQFGVELIYRHIAEEYSTSPNHPMDGLLQKAINSFTNPEVSDVGKIPKVIVDIDRNLPSCSLSTNTAVTFIVHQAVHNARRHAKATVIRVDVHHLNNVISVVVSDDGDGFDPEAELIHRHRGLANIRRYAASLRGSTLEIVSRKRGEDSDHGTTIRATIPLNYPEPSPSGATD